MSTLSFSLSTLLAVSGVSVSVYGIVEEEFKPVAIGLVLIFGAGVFATLYLGSRRSAGKRTDTATSDAVIS